MSKKQQIKPLSIHDAVMVKIKKNEVLMKPKWYFIVGSVLSFLGLVGSSITVIFILNLLIFLMRPHGPNGQWRLEQILSSLPIWVPLLSVLGVVSGISFLKKYDFSYKKNFGLVMIGFVLSLFLSAFILDYTNLNKIWMKRGPMLHLYEQRFPNKNPLN